MNQAVELKTNCNYISHNSTFKVVKTPKPKNNTYTLQEGAALKLFPSCMQSPTHPWLNFDKVGAPPKCQKESVYLNKLS